MELTVPAWHSDQETAARQYEALLASFTNLKIVYKTRYVARYAAQLRARYNIRSEDALQVACSILENATTFITNDRGFTRLQPVVDVLILDDYTI
jgi:predicted nucleic acid-binding protein